MHAQAWNWLQQVRTQYEFTGPTLEIGSIDINGSPRTLWKDCEPYVGIDIVEGKNVDCIVDLRDWDIINNRHTHPYLHHQFQTIICTEVLEHVDPETIIHAMFPYMGNECQVVITAASVKRKKHSADGSPILKPDEYYKNVKPEHLLNLLTDVPMYLECIDVSVILTEDGTDVYAYAKYRQTLRSA